MQIASSAYTYDGNIDANGRKQHETAEKGREAHKRMASELASKRKSVLSATSLKSDNLRVAAKV